MPGSHRSHLEGRPLGTPSCHHAHQVSDVQVPSFTLPPCFRNFHGLPKVIADYGHVKGPVHRVLNGYRVCAGRCVFVHAGTTRQVWDYQDFWSELSKAFIKIACIREMPLSMLRLSQVSLLGPFFVKQVSPGNRVKINSYSSAYKWDGEPKYQTGAAAGH